MAADSTSLKQYSRKEVEEHSNSRSCWIVLDNRVYDITTWLDDHPGGLEVLLEHAGADGTEDFEDVGHSTDARNMKDEYLIGEITEADRKTFEPSQMWTKTSADADSKANWTNVVLALIIGIVAFMIYRWLA